MIRSWDPWLVQADEELAASLPSLRQGRVGLEGLLHVCACARLRGIVTVLLSGQGAALQRGLWQSGRAFLHALPLLPSWDPHEEDVSPFLDALAANDLGGARSLALGWKGTTASPGGVATLTQFVMQHAFGRPGSLPDEDFLQAWEKRARPNDRPRLAVAWALWQRDAEALAKTLGDLAMALCSASGSSSGTSSGTSTPLLGIQDALAEAQRFVCPEILAWLQVAAHAGLVVEGDLLGAPPFLRFDRAAALDPLAWSCPRLVGDTAL